MRRRITIALGLTAALAGAYQVTQPAAAVDDNGLGVTWTDIAKPLSDVSYTLSGDATVTYGCFNNGGKNPTSQNKQVTFDQVMKSHAILQADAAGKVTGKMYLTLPEIGSRLTCPGGQTVLISSVIYKGVVLMNNQSAQSHRFDGEFAKVFRPIK